MSTKGTWPEEHFSRAQFDCRMTTSSTHSFNSMLKVFGNGSLTVVVVVFVVVVVVVVQGILWKSVQNNLFWTLLGFPPF